MKWLCFLALLATAPLGAQDPSYRFYFSPSGSSQTEAEVRTLLDSSSGQELFIWSYGVCHDTTAVTILDATSGEGALAVFLGGPSDFEVLNFGPDGVSHSCVTSSHAYLEGHHIDPQPGFELARITYQLVSESGSRELQYCETAGSPPFDLAVLEVNSSTAIFPAVDPHTIDFSISWQRGLCNEDSILDIADPVTLANALFATGEALSCPDACDANDDGAVDVGDIVTLFNWLFATSQPLPPPHLSCGLDPTPDDLPCTVAACP